jgi:hypothetical protein
VQVWRSVFVAATAAIVAAALVLPVAAAPGDPLRAGRVNGARGWNTSLYSTNPTATLTLVNNRTAGAPALSLRVAKGPALEVSNSARIRRLNADYVDGLNANGISRVEGCVTTNVNPDGNFGCDLTFAVPKPGFVLLHGSAETATKGTGRDEITCRFLYDDGLGPSPLPGSTRIVNLDSTDATFDTNCSTDGYLYLGSAGTHTITFSLTGIDASITAVGGVAAGGVYSPFDGAGSTG